MPIATSMEDGERDKRKDQKNSRGRDRTPSLPESVTHNNKLNKCILVLWYGIYVIAFHNPYNVWEMEDCFVY